MYYLFYDISTFFSRNKSPFLTMIQTFRSFKEKRIALLEPTSNFDAFSI